MYISTNMDRSIIFPLFLWIIHIIPGSCIYFSQPSVKLIVDSSTVGPIQSLPAVLEPDENGRIIYNVAKQSKLKNCPKVSVDSDGKVSVSGSSMKNGNISCVDYLLSAELDGTLGIRKYGTANLTLHVYSISNEESGKRDPKCTSLESEVRTCFGGLENLQVQVMENSGKQNLWTNFWQNGCQEQELTYSIKMLNPEDPPVLGVNYHGGKRTDIWVMENLDREEKESYAFTLTCRVGSSGQNYNITGSLQVLDQDDNLPTIGKKNDTNATHVVNFTLHDDNPSSDLRLYPDDKDHSNLFISDPDLLASNNFIIELANDTKNILNISWSSFPFESKNITSPTPDSTFVLLKIRMLSRLLAPPWVGAYCVQVLIHDTTLVPAKSSKRTVSFNLCLYHKHSHVIDIDPAVLESSTDSTSSPETAFTQGIPGDTMHGTCGPSCIFIVVICTSAIFTTIGAVLRKRYCGRKPFQPKIVIMPPSTASPPGPFRPPDPRWEVERSSLILGSVIGEGEFGTVLRAKFRHPADPDGKVVDAAVKMVKEVDNRSGCKTSIQEFYDEFDLLKQVDHHNVIKLLGVCTYGDGPPYLIMEYAEFKSLRSFLRKCRRVETVPSSEFQDFNGSFWVDMNPQFGGSGDDLDSVYTVTQRDILGFSWQVAKGMAYLSDMKLVHRDLAARNVLLTKDKVCKISDFGLMRDIYVDDAYTKKSKDRVPVKWLAPECLRDGVYTSKSDVWSYAIFVWELINLGASPYPGIPTESLFDLLQAGYRMAQPEHCPMRLYTMMRQCWSEDQANRPNFRQLIVELGSLLEDGEYMTFDIPSVSNPVYGCENRTDLANPSTSSQALRAPQQVLYTLTEVSESSSVSEGLENLRLIDHESSTEDSRFMDPLEVKVGNDYPNSFIHNNNNRDSRGGTSIKMTGSYSHEPGPATESYSAYESPIKIRA